MKKKKFNKALSKYFILVLKKQRITWVLAGNVLHLNATEFTSCGEAYSFALSAGRKDDIMLSGCMERRSVLGGVCSASSAPISTATTCPEVGGGGGGCEGGGKPPLLDT